MKDVESDTQAHAHTCTQNLPSHKYITTLTQTYTHTQQQHAYSAKSKSTTRVAVAVGVAAAAAASGALIYLSVFFVPRRAT